jgi:hypothetical protein
MIKTIILSILLFTVSFVLSGQEKPLWTQASERDGNYPPKLFFTGYTEGNVQADETVEQAKNRLIKDAQGLLSESIRVTVKNQTTSQTVSTADKFSSVFKSNIQTASNIEIVGIHTEAPYYDAATRIVYAFAYVSRSELTDYYKGNLSVNLSQAEGLLQTAKDLETAGEKAKARQQCAGVQPLLEKVRAIYDMLTTVSPGISSDDLQQTRTEAIYNRFVQMQAQLAQAVHVYVESNEYLFDTKVDIVANRLKAEMAKSGCSFVDDIKKADFKMNINVSTRHAGDRGNFVFCYADTQVELYDVRKQKVIYSDEISQKGGDTSHEKAARKAMSNVVPIISEKLKSWM